MNLLQKAIKSINFDEDCKVGGEYGLHDNFFNVLVSIDDVDYYVQGCADNNVFDANNCGHNDGICGDINELLAIKLGRDHSEDISAGYEDVQEILSVAFDLI